MKIQLVSHASVLIECGESMIWTDPWLVSKAFNNSWALLPEPDLKAIPYDKINYIWISHEHPDHFNIPTLKSMPEEFKQSVTVLFQKTNSDKVFEALRKFGFVKFIPMPNRELIELEPGLEVYCYQNHFIDSCLGVKSGSKVLFNVNDAEIEAKDCEQILDDLGHVDICLNQFSLAGYRGFAEREKILPRMAAEKLDRMLRNHRELKAGCTLPFASFVYFSCTDNRYLNRFMNKPQDVYRRFKNEDLECALLYPGDEWDTAAPFDSEVNVSRFEQLYEGMEALAYDEPPVISEEEILKEFKAMCATMHDHYPSLLLRMIPPFTAYVQDLGKSFRFDLYRSEASPVALKEPQCDIVVNSQPLHFGFKFPFGVETLAVSARFIVQHNYKAWQRFKRLCVLNSADIYLHPRYLFQGRNLSYLKMRLSASLVDQLLNRARLQRKIAT